MRSEISSDNNFTPDKEASKTNRSNYLSPNGKYSTKSTCQQFILNSTAGPNKILWDILPATTDLARRTDPMSFSIGAKTTRGEAWIGMVCTNRFGSIFATWSSHITCWCWCQYFTATRGTRGSDWGESLLCHGYTRSHAYVVSRTN